MSAPVSNIHFVVQSSPAGVDDFQEKLQALAGRIGSSTSSSEDVPPALQCLQKYKISQCVVASEHFAFLLEDGRVCRLRYSAHDLRDDQDSASGEPSASTSKSSVGTKTGERPSKALRSGSSSPWLVPGTELSSSGSSALRRWGTHIGVIRSAASSSDGATGSTTMSSSPPVRSRPRTTGTGTDTGSSSTGASGIRLVRTTQQLRGRGLQGTLLAGQRVIVPASHVPEELVNQVQGILQGKSRSTIIRELQRTNLDVNLAVNNLLSRDDEDNDDMDDQGNDYIPGDDLLSLLDSGIHTGEHGVFIDTDTVLPEELLGYTFHRASRTSSQRSGASGEGSSGRDLLQDRDPIIRLRSPRFFEPLTSDLDEPASQSNDSAPASKKMKVAKKNLESVSLGEDLDWWMVDGGCVKFVQIGAMYSELVAIDTQGILRQWRWAKSRPYVHPSNPKIFHPRAVFLNIDDKKVTHLAACSIRASVMAESGGVATWMDETVSRHASPLEHPLTGCVAPELEMQFNSPEWRANLRLCLHACALYSAVITWSGDMYWWGVLPYRESQRFLERAQMKLKKNLSSKKTDSYGEGQIKVGSQVGLHSCPMFQAGAIAIHIGSSGKPKVGCLQQSAWNLSDTCTFKIIKKKRRKKVKSEGSAESKKKEEMEIGRESDSVKAQDNTGTEASSSVPSNSERETVLKSTSCAPLPTFYAPNKSVKRKRTSSPARSYKDNSSSRAKSVREQDVSVEEMEEEAEEQWNLQDVIFIEDAQTIPVGKVLKIDGDMVAVSFNHGQKSKGTQPAPDADPVSILKNCRLLRKDDLHLLSSNTSPKVPECFQRTPKRVPLDAAFKVHSITANEKCIKAVEGGRDGMPISHLEVSLLGKCISDRPLPSPAELFFDENHRSESKVATIADATKVCTILNTSQDFPTVVLDRNKTLYPLLRNENYGFRDPRWLNLPPVTAVASGGHMPPPHSVISILKANNSSKSKMLVVTVLVFQNSELMTKIVQRDRSGIADILETADNLEAMSKETLDGNRNIIHVAVAMTAPSANHEEGKDDHGKKEDKPHQETVIASTTSVSSFKGGSTKSRSSSSARSLSKVSSGGSSVPRSSSGYIMSRSERADAVNAIANAISVVTRGGSGENASESRRSSSGTSTTRESRHTSSTADPFILPIPYPPNYMPAASVAPSSSAGFSSRFMRDIMQQFAAVLDDKPNDAQTGSDAATTTAPPTSTISGTRRVPSIIRQTPSNSSENSSDPFPLSRSSPTPAIPTLSWPPEPSALSSIPSQREEGLNLSVSDNASARYGERVLPKKTKRKSSLSPNEGTSKPAASDGAVADAGIVQMLCTSEALKFCMQKLLSQRDSLGNTPFMSAIYNRAYPAALKILNEAQAIARRECEKLDQEADQESSKTSGKYNCDNPKYKEVLMSMIYPTGSDPDCNPLYAICTNDTCSFTWTGDQHINQDIFECWTCGLTGTLCCCSECARVCHNGHDCKLKRTSPTAYCDCWEKCVCRSLVAGDSVARSKVFENLLYQTDLVNLSNARGETLLYFLAQTVARQTVEQRQHRTRSAVTSRTSQATKTTVTGVGYDIPRHDLQPPTFCRNAFLMLLNDWTSVRSTVMSGTPGYIDRLCASSILDQAADADLPSLLPEEQACMTSQTGTSRLDAFTLCLLVKCNMEYLEMLLETFVSRAQKASRMTEEEYDIRVIHRFVRSVARVFVILSVETQPGKQTGRTLSHAQPLKRAQRVFVTLFPMAIKELCETATALIDPVRMGVARPTATFPLLPSSAEAIQGCEAAFSRVPFPPREKKRHKNASGPGRNRHREPGLPTASFAIPQNSEKSTRPAFRGNYGRRGISRRRSHNADSSGATATRSGSEIARSNLAQLTEVLELRSYDRDEALGRNDYPPLTDEEEDEWLNREEEGGRQEQDDQEDRQAGTNSGDTEERLPLHRDLVANADEGRTTAEVADGDSANQEGVETSQVSSADTSQREVVSEGDLDLEDEDDTREDADVDDENDEAGEESDTELTLLAGAECDSDGGSSGSAGDDHEQGSDRTGRDAEQSRLLRMDDDDAFSVLDEDDEDDDEDDYQDAMEDDDDRRTYDKDSVEDEAGTATDVDDDNTTSSQDEEDEDDDDEADFPEITSRSEWDDLPLERAPTRLQRSRAMQAPHSMQWAMGSSASSARSTTAMSSTRQSGPGSGSNSGNLIYIDPSSLRRGSAVGVGSSAGTSNGSSGDSKKHGSVVSGHSVSTTNAQLARAFGICLREMADLFSTVWHGEHIGARPPSSLEMSYVDLEELKDFVEEKLTPTWIWLLTVIDSTEAQLRYGQVLSLVSSDNHLEHPLHKRPGKGQRNTSTRGRVPGDVYRRGGAAGARSTLSILVRMAREASNDSNSAREEFLSYALSLMRAHNGEHSDYLPVMDVSSLRHIAYVLDAAIYFRRETAAFSDESPDKARKNAVATRSSSEYKFGMSLNLGYDNTDDEEEEEVDTPSGDQDASSVPDELYSMAVSDVLVGNVISTSWVQAQGEADFTVLYAQPPKSYFRRSDSMTFLGCTEPDPFAEPLVKALPLADKPHLLYPNSRKEELFGRPRQRLVHDEDEFDPDIPGMGMGQLRHRMPEKFAKLVKMRKSKKSGEASIENQSASAEKVEEEVIDEPPESVIAGTVEKDMVEEMEQEPSAPVEEMKDGALSDEVIVHPVTAHVPVVTSNVVLKSEEEKPKLRKTKASKKKRFTLPSSDSLLGRSRLSLELFTKVFLADVGAEPKSVLQELGGFEVRESKFRKEMEKLRNSQSVDLQLSVEREPHRLLTQTFKQLNQHYRRRTSSISLSSMSQPMTVQRVKVVFKEEPGEGSGVARSFYTALCEALLSSKKLPPLDCILVSSSASRGASGVQNSLLSRLRKREQEREREHARRTESGGKKVNLRSYFPPRHLRRMSPEASSSTSSSPTVTRASELSTESPSFHPRSSLRGAGRPTTADHWPSEKRAIGERLLRKVNVINAAWARKITGVLLCFPVAELLILLSSDKLFKSRVADVVQRLEDAGYDGEEEEVGQDSSSAREDDASRPSESVSGSATQETARVKLRSPVSRLSPSAGPSHTAESDTGPDHDEEVDVSTFPLFYQPGKRGFYSPASGPNQPMPTTIDLAKAKTSRRKQQEARLNAFRNVGRIIGLCLLQNELCPLPLNRHVLKVLLGRKVNWHDFAFFDPVMYESLRYVLYEMKHQGNKELLPFLDLTFVADTLPEEGGGEVELVPGGASVNVTASNVQDYVLRYTTHRMIVCCQKYLEKMREGLFDVLPANALEDLTPEDLRLLLNGCGRVNVHTLISYTSFNDESGKSAGLNTEKLTEFKQWFWSVVERMSHSARQELLYFWTGSPALPASEDGFQPMPTITIRPPDDQHLPTANTCISRLYVPLYSARRILKQKLMTAIETKNFGFV